MAILDKRENDDNEAITIELSFKDEKDLKLWIVTKVNLQLNTPMKEQLMEPYRNGHYYYKKWKINMNESPRQNGIIKGKESIEIIVSTKEAIIETIVKRITTEELFKELQTMMENNLTGKDEKYLWKEIKLRNDKTKAQILELIEIARNEYYHQGNVTKKQCKSTKKQTVIFLLGDLINPILCNVDCTATAEDLIPLIKQKQNVINNRIKFMFAGKILPIRQPLLFYGIWPKMVNNITVNIKWK